MKYTVRYAHLAMIPKNKVGDIVRRGDSIGVMGSTGQSTGPHLHIDCVEGERTDLYKLEDIEKGNPLSCPRQLNYFIDKELFAQVPIITTYYADYRYQGRFNKMHPGYDVIPSDGVSKTIFWNRRFDGKVIAIKNDSAYGHCVYICFEVE